MRAIVFIFLLISHVFSQEVEVVADKFNANEALGKSEFTGNVVVKKGKDVLKAKKIVIYFDKKRVPLKYEAIGNCSLDIQMEDKNYYAKANKLTYEVDKNLYILSGKAFLHDKTSNKKIYGNLVKIDQSKGTYEVDGKGKSPVKFIFQVKDTK